MWLMVWGLVGVQQQAKRQHACRGVALPMSALKAPHSSCAECATTEACAAYFDRQHWLGLTACASQTAEGGCQGPQHVHDVIVGTLVLFCGLGF